MFKLSWPGLNVIVQDIDKPIYLHDAARTPVAM
jgi:hypothetical protein